MLFCSVDNCCHTNDMVLFQYFHDLFYLMPHFHTSFLLLEKIIVLDLDLEFRLQRSPSYVKKLCQIKS